MTTAEVSHIKVIAPNQCFVFPFFSTTQETACALDTLIGHRTNYGGFWFLLLLALLLQARGNNPPSTTMTSDPHRGGKATRLGDHGLGRLLVTLKGCTGPLHYGTGSAHTGSGVYRGHWSPVPEGNLQLQGTGLLLQLCSERRWLANGIFSIADPCRICSSPFTEHTALGLFSKLQVAICASNLRVVRVS